MDQVEGTKTGDPLSSPFPIRSSARSLGSEARPTVSNNRREGLTLHLSSSEEVKKKKKKIKCRMRMSFVKQHALLHKHCLHKHDMNERTVFAQSA